ncbi:MAG TPA: cytochrome P450 [Ilumatobacteraceae bacterium]
MDHDSAAATANASPGGNPLMDPKALVAPQPLFAGLRAAGVMNLGAQGVILSRRADIAQMLGDPAVFSSGMDVTRTGIDRPLIPLQIDPPKHRDYRMILNPIFAPQRMAELEESITALARELIEAFAGETDVDYVAHFSLLFPSQVFLTMMGLPRADLAHFLSLKDGFIRPESITGQPRNHEDSVALMRATATAIYEYFEPVIQARKDNPGTDLVTRLVETEVDGERLTHEEVLDTCFLLLVAGLDTVSASLDCMMLHLAQHPERRAELVADPALIPSAVEELLRWESPVMMVARVALEDTEISGCPVQKGQHVLALLGAANTDPEDMPDADVVRWGRDVNRHIAFGAGIHRCLGSHLARLELDIALREWHARIPDYSLPDGFEPVFNTSIRSLAGLPLRLPA